MLEGNVEKQAECQPEFLNLSHGFISVAKTGRKKDSESILFYHMMAEWISAKLHTIMQLWAKY